MIALIILLVSTGRATEIGYRLEKSVNAGWQYSYIVNYTIGSAIVYLAANDTLRIKIYQNQGAAVNTVTDSTYLYFHIHKIS